MACESRVGFRDMKTASVQAVWAEEPLPRSGAVGPLPVLVTDQETSTLEPEKTCGGSCTLVTSRAGGGLSVTVKPELICSLSVRLTSGMANGWWPPVPSGTT